MATLDDRILGEKLHYYCSSSEDEDEDEPEQKEDQSEDMEGREKLRTVKGPKFIPADQIKENHNEMRSWEGASTNTGPKGVLNDWQEFKKLEAEKRQENDRQRMALAKKLSMTCKSHLDDEKDKQRQQNAEEDEEVLIDEAFLRQYICKRMEEMRMHTVPKPTFGKVYNLDTGDEFLDAIDNEEKNITIVVHLYEKGVQGCEAMSGCMMCLAEEYPNVKFCRLKASAAGVSSKFKKMGLPAILVYKEGQLMGNFVRLIDEFGEDFFASDVESFLIEHGMLQDKSLEPSKIRDSSVHNKKANGDDDSDFSD